MLVMRCLSSCKFFLFFKILALYGLVALRSFFDPALFSNNTKYKTKRLMLNSHYRIFVTNLITGLFKRATYK